jgi:H2-forming N5,N10-methylenetetrahydromethanopterin dehydrogenase-like enzyme
MLAKISFIAILLLSLNVSAASYEVEKANDILIDCQFKAAYKYDDGISSASDIAPILVESCLSEANQLYYAVTSTVNGPFDQIAVRQAIDDMTLQTAIKVILLKRSNLK